LRNQERVSFSVEDVIVEGDEVARRKLRQVMRVERSVNRLPPTLPRVRKRENGRTRRTYQEVVILEGFCRDERFHTVVFPDRNRVDISDRSESIQRITSSTLAIPSYTRNTTVRTVDRKTREIKLYPDSVIECSTKLVNICQPLSCQYLSPVILHM
jgi:hypothetical protein